MVGEHRLAEAVAEEGRLSVERAAARRLDVRADEAGGERGLEQHRHLAGADLARPEARQRPLRRIAAHRCRRRHLLGGTHRAVPGVALHVGTAASRKRRDRRHRDRMPRTGVAAAEAARVAQPEVRLLRRDAGPFRVGDARVDVERRRFARERQLDRPGGVDVPRVEEVEVEAGGRGVGQGVVLGQAGSLVLGGEARDVPRGAHRLLDRGWREIRCAGVAAPLAGVDRDAHRLVAVALDVLGLALAHRHREAHAFRHLGRRIARAELAGVREGQVDEFAELLARVREAGSGAGRGGQGGVYDKQAP